MALDYIQLVADYGTPEQIPNALLYQYLDEHREDLINEMQLGVDRIPNSNLGKEVRRRCKSDLMWMARYFTWISNPISENGVKSFEENIFDEEHYGIFAELFVKKDETKPLNQQSEDKTRLLLWPRGGAKSTFDHVDTVQWILNFPSIRILYLTATNDLATGFVGEIKGHFYIKESPTYMNLFFPEFCVEEGKAGAADVFVCPVYAAKKTGRKEPTVIASSLGKSKAGWRYELIKADDAVSDTNSENSVACEKVSKQLFLAEKLLALGGYYIDYIGTRYADDDHYGVLLEKNVGEIETIEGHGWVLTKNKTTGNVILIGRALQIKPEVLAQLERDGKQLTYQEAGPDGCILLLPKVMPFKWCMGDFTKDEKSFEGQRNQNPSPASSITFDRNLMLRNTIPFNNMPLEGPVSQVWDFAFSQKKGSDFSTGCSIMWTQNAEGEIVGYVQEIMRGKYNPTELAQAVVDFAKKWRPFIVGVEGAAGSSFLESSIVHAARKTAPQDAQLQQLMSHIDWFPPDNQKDAKKSRMKALHPVLMRGGLKFFNACMTPNLDFLYSEFEKCTSSHHHDDIPDVISLQYKLYIPKASMALLSEDKSTYAQRDSWYNLIFEQNCDPWGNILPGMPAPSFDEQDFMEQEEISSKTPGNMPNILGAGIFG